MAGIEFLILFGILTAGWVGMYLASQQAILLPEIMEAGIAAILPTYKWDVNPVLFRMGEGDRFVEDVAQFLRRGRLNFVKGAAAQVDARKLSYLNATVVDDDRVDDIASRRLVQAQLAKPAQFRNGARIEVIRIASSDRRSDFQAVFCDGIVDNVQYGNGFYSREELTATSLANVGKLLQRARHYAVQAECTGATTSTA